MPRAVACARCSVPALSVTMLSTIPCRRWHAKHAASPDKGAYQHTWCHGQPLCVEGVADIAGSLLWGYGGSLRIPGGSLWTPGGFRSRWDIQLGRLAL